MYDISSSNLTKKNYLNYKMNNIIKTQIYCVDYNISEFLIHFTT